MKFIHKLWPLACLFFFAAVQDGSAFINGGLRQTMGTRNYAGTDGFLDLGDSWHIRPAFSSYHSDTSSRAYNAYSLRLGYDQNLWGIGVTGGLTPSVNGYRNHFVGVDGIVSLTPTGGKAKRRLSGAQREAAGAASGRGLAEVDLGGSVLYTGHHDDQSLILGRTGQVVSGGLGVGETDLNANAGVSFLMVDMSASITKSVYDRKNDQLDLFSAQRTQLEGVNSLVQGLPDTVTNFKMDFSLLPILVPFVSYTHTRFRVLHPDSNAYTVGVRAQLEILEADASYERYDPGQGQSARNYYSMGASLRF